MDFNKDILDMKYRAQRALAQGAQARGMTCAEYAEAEAAALIIGHRWKLRISQRRGGFLAPPLAGVAETPGEYRITTPLEVLGDEE